MSRRHRRKKIRLVLEARNPDDARRIADAIIEATRPPGDRRGQKPTSESGDIATTAPDEQLETSVRSAVGAHLDAKAESEMIARSEAGVAPDSRTPESPDDVIEKRGWLVRFYRECRAIGIEIVAKVIEGTYKGHGD